MSVEQYLAGKTAIVTGSSKANGIGAATALALAKHGANVLIHYNSNAVPAEEVVASVKTLGVQAIAAKADASSASFGNDLVSAALEGLNTKSIDIVVNNAAIVTPHPQIADVDPDTWSQHFNANVRAPFLLVQAALPHMPRGGRIVNIGSVAGELPIPSLYVYGASKAALTYTSAAMKEELAVRGITINVVNPGAIATDLSMQGNPVGDRLMSLASIKREGEPAEVANTILFLTSPASSFITGQLIAVDGGIQNP